MKLRRVCFTRVTLKKIPQGIAPTGFNSGGTIISAGLPVLGNFFNSLQKVA